MPIIQIVLYEQEKIIEKTHMVLIISVLRYEYKEI